MLHGKTYPVSGCANYLRILQKVNIQRVLMVKKRKVITLRTVLLAV